MANSSPFDIQNPDKREATFLHRPTSRSIWIGIALAAIILVNVLASLYWIDRNEVLVGHDSSSYLYSALEYYELLEDVTIPTLFRAFTESEYRSPGLFLAVQPFLSAFGPNMDSAQLFNILMLAVLLWTTYMLGRSVEGDGVGLFSALLIGLLPMLAAMARLFYTELALTAAVTFSLLALLRSNGFRSRGWSIAWGVGLGLGMLIKWALPIYLLLPIAWTLWHERSLFKPLLQWRNWRIDTRALLIAVAAGLTFVALWAWPNRSQFDQFLLGDLLYVGWFLIVGLWTYSILQTSSAFSNFWLGLFSAALIASFWYLPHIDFVSDVLIQDRVRGGQDVSRWNPRVYYRDMYVLYSAHFGRLASWLLLPIGLFPWLRALLRRTPIRAHSSLLWTCFLSTYMILALLAQDSPRFLVPILPSVVILLVVGLWQYRLSLRVVFACSWVFVLGAQWGMFTFDSLNPVYAQTEDLWAGRYYATPPSTYETDIGYWIGPDILERVETEDGQVQRLGVLVNSDQLHRGILKYLIKVEDRPVKIIDMTEADSAAWYDMLSSQWVLVKDGDNHNVEAPGQAVLSRIFGGDALFDALHELVEVYPLPNGETVYLYQRTKGPGLPKDLPLLLAQTEGVADEIRQAWSSHANLVYTDPDLAVWVGIHDPADERAQILQDTDERVLSALHDTILVVWDHEADSAQEWFDANAYRTYEVGDDFASVAIYGRPTDPLQPMAAAAVWPAVELRELQSWPTVAIGQVLPVSTQWIVGDDRPLKLSMRLIDAEGTTIASHDRPLVDSDSYGLFIPPDSSPGAYALNVVLYDPTNLQTVDAANGDDSITLTEIQVEN